MRACDAEKSALLSACFRFVHPLNFKNCSLRNSAASRVAHHAPTSWLTGTKPSSGPLGKWSRKMTRFMNTTAYVLVLNAIALSANTEAWSFPLPPSMDATLRSGTRAKAKAKSSGKSLCLTAAFEPQMQSPFFRPFCWSSHAAGPIRSSVRTPR